MVKNIGWLMLLLCLVIPTLAITGDEVLDRMRDAFNLGDEGDGILVSIEVQNDYANGVSTSYRLAVVADAVIEEDAAGDADDTTYVLMYFLGGDDEGMIFLLHQPDEQDAASRMWLYIAAFGLTKELITDQDQSGRFAGSTFSYGDIAGARDLREDYRAELLREDVVTVGLEERMVWVLELTPRETAVAEYERVVLWVDQEANQFLRLEGYDTGNELAKEIVVAELGTFEERRVPETLIGRDVATGDVSTLRMHDMRRPDMPLSREVFQPSSLATFDVEMYGF
jgi:hypothetical protein